MTSQIYQFVTKNFLIFRFLFPILPAPYSSISKEFPAIKIESFFHSFGTIFIGEKTNVASGKAHKSLGKALNLHSFFSLDYYFSSLFSPQCCRVVLHIQVLFSCFFSFLPSRPDDQFNWDEDQKRAFCAVLCPKKRVDMRWTRI